jgi:peptide/nickel transport system substrate-binding protein
MRKSRTAKVLATAAVMFGLAMPALAASGSTPHLQNGGSVTFDLDETLAGFNVNTSASNEYVLQEIMNLVWPQLYVTTGSLKEVLNTDFVTKVAVSTVNGQQKIVYTINPKATWQDGTPINADDFIYNWQALSGNQSLTDVDGQPYDAAGTTGYNQIQSVTGSNPPGGNCDPGSTANRNAGLCPNGKTVTVVFQKGQPFADWQALFSDIVPAHKARVVGWNTGFNINGGGDESTVVSGGPYYIKSYDSSAGTVVLAKNPNYWGTPGRLDTIVFLGGIDDASGISDLQSGTTNIFEPITASLPILLQAQGASGIKYKTTPGLQFEHFDFNQSNPYLAKLQVRQAIAWGVNRKTLITDTVGQISPNIKPLDNRMYMNNQPQYVPNGKMYDNSSPAKAIKLLKSLHWKIAKDGYFHPNYGPEKGKPLTLTISSTTNNPTRASTEVLFQQMMKKIGIKILITDYPAGTLFPMIANGQYQIAEFAWVATPFVSSNESIYCSYNKPICGQNWVHFKNAQVDKLVLAGAAATNPAKEAQLFNAADKILWNQMVTLPLYQKPIFDAWTSNVANVVPNPSSQGLTWNAQTWGLM